ncbi:DUF3465 domain-containing protein [Ferrimonas lipolytica]|uniref:DUF3465 domain-containing protein n=1 Tax=Ferrimonas lipolytica TaxID=2724191 RepID=A0A6H1UJR5_9GAMM|nr:DUF3465 domain-containing protein [Ferrimonas lipolytica]
MIFAIVAVALALSQVELDLPPLDAGKTTASVTGSSLIEQAFTNQQSDVQVEGSGTVTKLLADDLKGSRHQRFIITLASNRTLLIAHNIDLAPRIDALAVGDTVYFYGEYEWNQRGGVLHWTHHDPRGHHVDGWLRHHNRVYQ